MGSVLQALWPYVVYRIYIYTVVSLGIPCHCHDSIIIRIIEHTIFVNRSQGILRIPDLAAISGAHSRKQKVGTLPSSKPKPKKPGEPTHMILQSCSNFLSLV